MGGEGFLILVIIFEKQAGITSFTLLKVYQFKC